MIVRTHPSPSSRRRPAFTLVEVLVVVAIVVILASVGTIATMKFLDDAKNDKARMDAATISNVAKDFWVKNPDWDPSEQNAVGRLTPYLDKGADGLIDPWGQQFQMKPVDINQGSGTPQYRLYVFAIRPDDRREFGFPRELEGQGGGVKAQ